MCDFCRGSYRRHFQGAAARPRRPRHRGRVLWFLRSLRTLRCPPYQWRLVCCCVGEPHLRLAFGTKFSLLGVVLTKAVQNSPCMQKNRQIEPFLVCRESFVPDMWRGWVCRESFVPDMRRGQVCGESFVPKGPGAVVVGRVVLCSCVVLVQVGGLWQYPAVTRGHCGWALRVRRCPPHQWGPVADG